ncbi:helix-turn-helix transcriptional regulator [Fictibacillus barbaricus]|uniref:Helix-turn-helix transcriptional regulator n=1 Tax=Fictibacillus barbaricus TaxID=182136 RepID=A0ABS2ZEB9_9BACL|nr:helix-turn-helix transcriptional regulator [Fictibacillus barbaricus]MBN3546533.1 helix-turn-helix transcriptional regulator [Fictibacillus barbaricus]GGB41764.1 hypothetical protein GCM10007199_03800 [Fictibacillus barbaricus]
MMIEDEPIYDSIISQALHHMHEHAFSGMSMKDLSSGMNLSSVQFTRRFKESLAVSPLDYLTSLRLRRARTLLM